MSAPMYSKVVLLGSLYIKPILMLLRQPTFGPFFLRINSNFNYFTTITYKLYIQLILIMLIQASMFAFVLEEANVPDMTILHAMTGIKLWSQQGEVSSALPSHQSDSLICGPLHL